MHARAVKRCARSANDSVPIDRKTPAMGGPDKPAIDNLLKVARAHRQHERYYAMQGLEDAAALRRDANALKALAERWLEPVDGVSGAIDDPRFDAAGCPDLNAAAATANAGILFMEGEGEPSELTALKRKLSGVAGQHAAVSAWLLDMVDRAWEREAILLEPATATAAYRRHMTVTRTSLAAGRLGVAARLVGAAHTALAAQDFRPPAIRADRRGAAELVRTAAWLLDAATAVLAEQASQIGHSDADWTTYIEALEPLVAGSPAPPADERGPAPGSLSNRGAVDAVR
jgi:hypothetical protein